MIFVRVFIGLTCTQKLTSSFLSELRDIKVNKYSSAMAERPRDACFSAVKNRFWATLWELMGNVRTPSIARCKSRGRLPIRRNWTFTAISYGNLSKSTFFQGGRLVWTQISDGKGPRPSTTVGVRKLVIAFLCGIKSIRSALFGLSQSTRVTDRRTNGRTDGQNYDSEDRASIAASRGKN